MDKKVTDVGSLREGSYLILDGSPCVVKSIQTSKTGKHGHAKCRIEAIGLIDNQKRIVIYPSHDKIDVPIVEKKEAQIVSVHDKIANIMDLETYETFNIDIPEEFSKDASEGKQIIYWLVMGQKVIKQVR